MRTRSAKAKGKRLEKLVLNLLREKYNFTEDDCRITVGQEAGADIKFSKAAQARFPFAIECKNQEALGPIYTMFDQAVSHTKGTLMPLLVIKKNARPPLCVLPLEVFFNLIKLKDV